jgi:hypothetical protein
VQQIAGGYAVDVGKPPIRRRLEIKARQQLEQVIMGVVRDRDWERLFIERLDITGDETAQQPVQAALFRLVPAQAFKFLLEGFEGPQPMMLLRKPGIKIVHVSLFKREKKLWMYSLGRRVAQMRIWHPCVAQSCREPSIRRDAPWYRRWLLPSLRQIHTKTELRGSSWFETRGACHRAALLADPLALLIMKVG